MGLMLLDLPPGLNLAPGQLAVLKSGDTASISQLLQQLLGAGPLDLPAVEQLVVMISGSPTTPPSGASVPTTGQQPSQTTPAPLPAPITQPTNFVSGN